MRVQQVNRVIFLSIATFLALVPPAPVARAEQARAFPAAATYAGTMLGKVYRRINGDVDWQEVDSGLPGAGVTSLVVAPRGPNRVYLGTDGSGIYATSNGGMTWQQDDGNSTALSRSVIRGVVVDPFDASYVYAATAAGVVYASSDGGLDWTGHALSGAGTITCLGISPEHRLALLAGTTDGAQISTDGGDTWQPVAGIATGVRVNGFAFSANDANVAYAATSDGVYAAFDGGQAWGPVNHEQRGLPIESIAVDPHDDAHVLAGGDGAVYQSTDGGVTWETESLGAQTSIAPLLFLPGRAGTVLAGVTGGATLLQSDDGGSSFAQSLAAAGPGDQVVAIGATIRDRLPSDPIAPPPPSSSVQYFAQSHHSVRGLFLYIYQHYGGLRLFGLPLTEQFSEDGQTVQYFERVEFVLHSRTFVYLADLGDAVTADRSFPTVHAFASTPARMYVPSTHHSLSGRFLTFWKTHDGENTFGDPISEPLYEQNGDGTGRTYLVQYFDAARMEYHPELAGSPFEVSLGLLGRQVLRQRGWL